MTTIKQSLSHAAALLQKAGIDSAQAEAEIIHCHILKISRTRLYLMAGSNLTDSQLRGIKEILAQRCRRFPLQYLTGAVQFHEAIIKVDPSVLIPRPETELLVDMILQENDQSEKKVLDLCTGSGAIAIALKKKRPAWQITASDISTLALKLAESNATANNCWIRFIESDLFENIKDKFDIIVSNPPYISFREYKTLEPELHYEPEIALTAPDNGLYFYDKILCSVSDFLKDSAIIYLEIGADQAKDIASSAKKFLNSNPEVINDLNHYPRIMKIRI